jgi:beta-xylosidase
LGLGESGNFPTAIRVVAEWFPPKERSVAAGLFNAGSNVGAIFAPLLVPLIALNLGWRTAFIALGCLDLVWLAFWLGFYHAPEKSQRLGAAERQYILRGSPAAAEEKKIPWRKLLGYRQAWAYYGTCVLVGPVWWFYGFWLPDFFNKQFHLNLRQFGLPLVLIYSVTCLGSVFGGALSAWLLKKGWTLNRARKTATLICACSTLPVMLAPRVGSVWLAAGFFALAAAAHQGWSATMYTVVSDIFPKNAVASVVGFGGTLADHPAGTWSAPLLLQEGKGLIYPCPLWDDDGQAYLVHAYAFSRSGLKHALRVRPMAPDGSRLLGAGHIVFHDPARQPIIEGPKFLKKDGWHYISAPAGGVETGWQVALRSRRIYGPYEDRIVLQQGGTPVNGPHQGALVDAPNGDWWFVHFQDAGVCGRITHLQPVQWRDGWPGIGSSLNGQDIGQPVLRHAKPSGAANSHPIIPQTSDEFDAPLMGWQWQWQANHREDWYQLGALKSRLRLYPQFAPREHPIRWPSVLLQKFPARSFTVETLLEFAPQQNEEEAGLIVAGESFATLTLERKESGNHLVMRINGVQQFVHPHAPDAVKLRVAVKEDGLCVFSFDGDGVSMTIPQTYTARKGVWIGAKVGLYSQKRHQHNPSGHADIDYFRFM